MDCLNQGLQFRYLPPVTCGTYWSARLSVRGPPATGRFRQKSTIDGRLKGEIDRRRSIEREKGRKKRKKKKKRKEEKKDLSLVCGPRPCAATGHGPSPPARGERSRRLPYRYRDELGTPVWIGVGAPVNASYLDGASDLRRALSLLSAESWVPSDPEPVSDFQFMNARTFASHSATCPTTTTTGIQQQYELPLTKSYPVNLQSNGSQFPEFQLHKTPSETQFFGSTHIH
ncbi:hypothetical protein GW17_00008071 [Ensete ventricosum]|nr:hypothetical protein GW17_00008071 [Ensete ventricosum]RZS01908.1 hypothetical protein BHM03_00031867 [Ensete ventricosum]